MTKYYVYELCYPDGTPFYVGKGKGKRQFKHFMKSQRDGNKWKNNVIDKIQQTNNIVLIKTVKSGIIEGEAFSLECSLIKQYGLRINGGLLTNLTMGGEGASGRILSDESKLKIANKLKGRIIPRDIVEKTAAKLRGRKRSVDTIQKIADANRGKKRTIEVCKRISDSKRGDKNPNINGLTSKHKLAIGQANTGKKRTSEQIQYMVAQRRLSLTEESRRKIALSKSGKNNPNYGKPRDKKTRAKISEALKRRNAVV